jgi:hypothetical protein
VSDFEKSLNDYRDGGEHPDEIYVNHYNSSIQRIRGDFMELYLPKYPEFSFESVSESPVINENIREIMGEIAFAKLLGIIGPQEMDGVPEEVFFSLIREIYPNLTEEEMVYIDLKYVNIDEAVEAAKDRCKREFIREKDLNLLFFLETWSKDRIELLIEQLNKTYKDDISEAFNYDAMLVEDFRNMVYSNQVDDENRKSALKYQEGLLEHLQKLLYLSSEELRRITTWEMNMDVLKEIGNNTEDVPTHRYLYLDSIIGIYKELFRTFDSTPSTQVVLNNGLIRLEYSKGEDYEVLQRREQLIRELRFGATTNLSISPTSSDIIFGFVKDGGSDIVRLQRDI